MTNQDLDIWHVKLANGETRALSLDELDAGFHAGWITEQTLVLPAGAIRWAPLAEVAGLDETPPPVSAMPNSIAPYAIDSFGIEDSVPFDLDVPMDAESDADVQAFRPRRGRKIIGIMTAMAVVAGLGFAGVQARPALSRALGSHGSTHAVQAPATPPPPVAPAPAPAPVPVVAQPAIPTMAAASLPSAPATPDKKPVEAKPKKTPPKRK